MKRVNVLLLLVLIAAIGAFGAYMYWVHGNLDTTGPVLYMDEELLSVSVEEPESALLQGVTAVDDRDGDVTASILVESVQGIDDDNMATVTYAAFDSAGNVSKLQRRVCYTDYREPRFVLYGSPTFAFGSGFDLLDYVGAEDVLDGDIRRRVHATLVSDTKSIAQEGFHEVRLQVTNDLGDTVELILPVQVYDPEWYMADVELSEYLIYLERGARFNPRDYLESFLFRGEPMEIDESINVDIDNGVLTGVPGVYEVTYILSMNANMTTYSGIAKLIVVVQ